MITLLTITLILVLFMALVFQRHLVSELNKDYLREKRAKLGLYSEVIKTKEQLQVQKNLFAEQKNELALRDLRIQALEETEQELTEENSKMKNDFEALKFELDREKMARIDIDFNLNLLRTKYNDLLKEYDNNLTQVV